MEEGQVLKVFLEHSTQLGDILVFLVVVLLLQRALLLKLDQLLLDWSALGFDLEVLLLFELGFSQIVQQIQTLAKVLLFVAVVKLVHLLFAYFNPLEKCFVF